MSNTDIKICKDLCFRTRTLSVKKASEAHVKYNEHDKDSSSWLQEGNPMPIFIDTNVFLNIYDISEKERECFIRFLKKNKDRIYVSSQVQREYLRHRILQIRGVKSKIMKLKNEILTSVSNIDKVIDNKLLGIKGIAYRSVVKYGMPNTYNLLSEIIKILDDDDCKKSLSNAQSISEKIKDVLNNECSEFESISLYERSDALMDAISNLKILPSLDDDERLCIIDMYKKCRERFDNETNKMTRTTITFPGSGNKNKPVEESEEESVAWGDLYIYCDMLKYMKQNETNVLFITRDIAKGDWLSRENHKPFAHYIENAYEQTGYLMFIKESDNYLPLVTENNPVSMEETDNEDDCLVPCQDEVITIHPTEERINELKKVAAEAFVDINKSENINTLPNIHKYRIITPEQFIKELNDYSDWTNSYGAGFVSKNYFIYDILGQKKYDYNTSKEVLQILIKDGTLSVTKVSHDNKEIECILINEKKNDLDHKMVDDNSL